MIPPESKDTHPGFSKKLKIALVSVIIALFTGYTIWIDGSNNGIQNPHILTGSAAEGKLLFQKYNCQACHQLYGLGGYMGPDLTNVYSAKGKGPLYMTAFLQNGTNRMPNFHLSHADISSLISYLATVDSTNGSALRNYKISWYGSIEFTAPGK